MQKLVCPECNYQTENDERFCCKCGTQLVPAPEKAFCRVCGAELKPDAEFCSKCGTKRNKTLQVVFCSNCGAELNRGELYCGKCGVKVGTSETEKSDFGSESLYQKGLTDYENWRYVSAFDSFWKAAEQGPSKAQYYLSLCYYWGHGVKVDMEEADNWKKKAADQGINDNNINDTPESLLMKAEHGDAEAQYRVGEYYLGFDKNGTQRSLIEAEKWFRRAADQGNAPAQAALAWNYLFFRAQKSFWQQPTHFERIRQDRENAELCLAAVEQGNIQAMTKLGFFYENGIGVEKNKEKAFRLYCMAAKEGVGEYDVGRCYQKGIGTTKDKTEAVKWFRKAMEHGDPFAEKELG